MLLGPIFLPPFTLSSHTSLYLFSFGLSSLSRPNFFSLFQYSLQLSTHDGTIPPNIFSLLPCLRGIIDHLCPCPSHIIMLAWPVFDSIFPCDDTDRRETSSRMENFTAFPARRSHGSTVRLGKQYMGARFVSGRGRRKKAKRIF